MITVQTFNSLAQLIQTS